MLAEKTGETPLRIAVFYPSPRQIGFKIGKDKPEKPMWTPDGKHTVNGMFAKGPLSKRVFNFLKHMKIDAVKDGEIAPEF